MKKIIAFILVAVICATALFSCAKPEPVAKDILDENGNKIAVGYYDGDKLVREEKEDDKGNLVQKTEYDDDGKVEKVENYNLGTLYVVEEYKYEDEKGSYNKTTVTYNNKGDMVSNKETKYKNSLPVEEISTVPSSDENAAQVIDRTKYTYNEDGTVLVVVSSDAKTVKETLLDKKGNTVYNYEFNEQSSVKSFYDKDKRVSKTETYNTNGELISVTENEYNEDGVQIGSKSYKADGTLRGYSNYVYNDDGKLIGIYKYNADDTINCTVTYDENGKATINEGVYLTLGE